MLLLFATHGCVVFTAVRTHDSLVHGGLLFIDCLLGFADLLYLALHEHHVEVEEEQRHEDDEQLLIGKQAGRQVRGCRRLRRRV